MFDFNRNIHFAVQDAKFTTEPTEPPAEAGVDEVSATVASATGSLIFIFSHPTQFYFHAQSRPRELNERWPVVIFKTLIL